MKISAVSTAITYYIDTDDGEYRRSSSGYYEQRYNDSWEPAEHIQEELEPLFQQYMQSQAHSSTSRFRLYGSYCYDRW